MTTPAHDSVAYLPARPRLALLRKEADQLILCLPYPTLRPMGLVFRRPRGRAICRVADRGAPYPSSVRRLDGACIRRLRARRGSQPSAVRGASKVNTHNHPLARLRVRRNQTERNNTLKTRADRLGKKPRSMRRSRSLIAALKCQNSKTILNADSATAMGEYYFTTLEGTVAKVEYTFQYKRGADGNLKIVVHHSSLPYSP